MLTHGTVLRKHWGNLLPRLNPWVSRGVRSLCSEVPVTKKACGTHWRHDMKTVKGGWKACGRCGTLSSRGVPTEVRFWAHTKKVGNCIEWTGSLVYPWKGQERYYGKLTYGPHGNKKTARAHRYAWFLAYGKWPSKELDHLCQNQRCVKVQHLEEVTHRKNIRRKPGYGYCKRGHKFVKGNHYKHRNGKWFSRRCKICLRAKRRNASCTRESR